MDNQDTQSVHVREMPSSLWKRLKMAALESGHTLREAVILAIQSYLDTPGAGKPDKT